MIDILRNNLQLAEISYKRADWANFRGCDDIVKGGEVIWEGSPYDTPTTDYLIATYPAYWNEIKAFGRSHPNLVPFVNTTPDIAPYVCGAKEPDEMYPITSTKPYNTHILSTSQSRMKGIAYYVHPSSAKYLLFVDSGNWGNANGCGVQSYSGSLQIIQNTTIQNISFGAAQSTKNFTCDVTVNKLKLTSGASTLGEKTLNTWYGYNMTIGSNNAGDGFLWQSFQLYEGDEETHRFLTLTNNFIWDAITRTLINNN